MASKKMSDKETASLKTGVTETNVMTPENSPLTTPEVKLPKVELATITLLVAENPKRGKSRARFNLYRSGMTTHEFVLAGGYSADIAWDVKRGFIKLS